MYVCSITGVVFAFARSDRAYRQFEKPNHTHYKQCLLNFMALYSLDISEANVNRKVTHLGVEKNLKNWQQSLIDSAKHSSDK